MLNHKIARVLYAPTNQMGLGINPITNTAAEVRAQKAKMDEIRVKNTKETRGGNRTKRNDSLYD